MAVTRVTYCTREDVQRALDVKETARSSRQIDRAIEASSDAIDGGADGPNRGAGLLKRRFFPEVKTVSFDWPNSQRARSWRLWLDQHELVSATTVTSGGTTIAASDYVLYPSDGPPYNRLEIDLSSTAAFDGGDTHQQSISINGTWCGCDTTTATAGTLAEALDASETAVDVSDSSLIGVGDLIVVDSERMLVTSKAMLDTGVNIDAGDSLTAAASDVSITMSTTTNAPTVDEVILIDSERMLVVDVAGTVLTVKRAWDGSVLAAHAGGADIYAPRTLTVTRGAYGTTAAAHDSGDTVARHVVPGLVRDFSLGLALVQLLGEQAGYARTAGTGEAQREVTGRGLAQLRKDCIAAYGRKARIRGV
ncbi:hypothetical protein ACQEVF_25320 [Nonomuraea polychroma]|uniref:hypothetical protein n=1 Tax=Nonomuraea polychroma TaxID=46176 RepID=UPI003D8DEFE9